MQTIEAAIAERPTRQQWEIAQWLEQSLHSEETPAMLAAIDEGIRSLETDPIVPVEKVRQKIKGWTTTNIS